MLSERPETTPLTELHELGQSIWIDYVSREMLQSGMLARYRDEDHVTGLTANPTILEKAISDSRSYDALISQHADPASTAQDLFWKLGVADVSDAADILRPAYAAADGSDGFACLEVSPHIAYDATATIRAARDLASRLDRPNTMVKVPGTRPGIEAIEELTFAGVNVNVTLLFSVTQWEAAWEAYTRGLQRRLEADRSLDDVHSVASLFLSRIDAAANDLVPDELRNCIAVSVAKLTYMKYREMMVDDVWTRLVDAGARPQRLLWASTGTKDPMLPPTYYVTEVAAPLTVNTMPEGTLVAFAEQGYVAGSVENRLAEAHDVVDSAQAAGLDLDALASDLQLEGVQKFATSYDAAVNAVWERARTLEVPV